MTAAADKAKPETRAGTGGAREGAGRIPNEIKGQPLRSAAYPLRMTPDERAKLERLAAAAGMTPAEWLRDRIGKAKDPQA